MWCALAYVLRPRACCSLTNTHTHCPVRPLCQVAQLRTSRASLAAQLQAQEHSALAAAAAAAADVQRAQQAVAAAQAAAASEVAVAQTTVEELQERVAELEAQVLACARVDPEAANTEVCTH